MRDCRPTAHRLTLAPAARPGTLLEELPPSKAEVLVRVPDGSTARGRPFFGSKFWPLADELSSEAEDEDGVELGRLVAGDATSAQPATENLDGKHAADAEVPQVCTLSTCADTNGKSSAYKQQERSCNTKRAVKPWRRPLPARRASPKLTLGDVLARAHRRHASAVRGKGYNALVGAHTSAVPSPIPTDVPPTSPEKKGWNSNFKLPGQFERDPGKDTRKARETNNGPVRSILFCKHGRTAYFRFSPGLGSLFARTGKLRPRVVVSLSPPVHTCNTQCY